MGIVSKALGHTEVLKYVSDSTNDGALQSCICEELPIKKPNTPDLGCDL